jgi:tRNA (cytidine/uridine-2'-O-)-methyltransferase
LAQSWLGLAADDHPRVDKLGPMIGLVLYQPDIPPNAGTLLRLGACLGVPVHVIEPCGFPFSDRAFRRAALDYPAHAEIHHHRSFAAFLAERPQGRLVLLNPSGAIPYFAFRFAPDDMLILGRESTGAGPEVLAAAEHTLAIPMRPGLRSINVAIAAAMVLGEALRQTGLFPQGGEFSHG